MQTNKTIAIEAHRPQCQEASHAARPLLSWAPLLQPTAMGKESHTHQPGQPGGRNTQLKSMCKATMTRAAGFVHCAQRTMLATTASLFAERLQVSLKCTFDKTHKKTKCHPVFIHFVRKHTGKDTKKCLPQAITSAMLRL